MCIAGGITGSPRRDFARKDNLCRDLFLRSGISMRWRPRGGASACPPRQPPLECLGLTCSLVGVAQEGPLAYTCKLRKMPQLAAEAENHELATIPESDTRMYRGGLPLGLLSV